MLKLGVKSKTRPLKTSEPRPPVSIGKETPVCVTKTTQNDCCIIS